MTQAYIDKLIKTNKKLVEILNEHGYDSDQAKNFVSYLVGYIDALEKLEEKAA